MTEQIEGEIIQAETAAGAIEVVKIKYGQKIDKPGVYDMPMLWYHGDCCIGPSISSSGLRTIFHQTPLHYWDSSPLNPNQYVDPEKDETPEAEALRIGRAAHTLLLEPHLFKSLYVVRPTMFDSWRTKDSQKWRSEQQREGFTVFSPKEMQRVYDIRSALAMHPLYEQGLLDGDIERALIWKDAKSGVWLKSRPDAIPHGTNTFADLKVTFDASALAVRRMIFDRGYDMQMALGGIGMREILRREVEDYAVVAVESKRPHGIRIAPIAHRDILRAHSLLRWSLDKFTACLEEGYWPSYDDQDTEYVHRTDFAAERIDERIKKGELPKGF